MGGVDPTPDWANKSVHIVFDATASRTTHTPFTVPEDGWIVNTTAFAGSNGYYEWHVNGNTAFATSFKVIGSSAINSFSGVATSAKFVPYPVKKGDVVDCTQYSSQVTCTFAPCRGNSAKTN